MSEFKCEVVPIELSRHPNADSLSLVKVYGYTCVCRTADWTGQTKAVYVPVDAQCPDREPFRFLGSREKDRRIKAKRLRGIFSMGLLVPAEPDWEVGRDVTELLGVTKYEEPEVQVPGQRGPSADEGPRPPGFVPGRYDIENLRRYSACFVDGETVIATEKIHGANARYTLRDGQLYVGSRSQWKRDTGGSGSPWFRHEHLGHIKSMLERINERTPEVILYGEVFGAVQDLRYGCGPGEVRFRAFDLFGPQHGWFDHSSLQDWCGMFDIPTAPVVYRGPYGYESLLLLAEQDSQVHPGGIGEGLVVRPEQERFSERLGGRLILKLHGQRFLLRPGV